MRVNNAMVAAAAAVLLIWGLGATRDPITMGVVDLEQAVNSTEEGRAARDEFERKKRDAEARLQPLVESFQEKGKEFEAKKFVLSEDALRQRELDLIQLRNKIENMQKEVQTELEIDRERLVGPLRVKLIETVEEVGRREGFSIIMLRNAPGVMYTRETLDVTEMIIKAFNEKG